MRFAYTQGTELGYWWLDGYVDFSEPQTLRAREALVQWFAWHRRNQLPEYAALLNRAATEVVQDSNAAQVCRWFDEAQARIDVAVERALPDAAAIAATFDAEQLTYLARKQAKNMAEFRDDFLQAEPAARNKASVERAVERAEQLYGRLGDAQRERIVQGVAASPFDADRWGAERLRRQRDMAQLLRQLQDTKPSREAGAALLRGYWQRVKASPDEAYARYQTRLQAYNCEWLAQIHNATTAEQRLTAQRRLKGWEADARTLVGPP